MQLLFWSSISATLLALTFTVNAIPDAASTPTVSASTPTSTSDYVSDDTFRTDVLNSTNFFRSEHNASALTWNSSLADYASNWASGCNFAHSGGKSGENLAEGYLNVTSAIDTWGNERAKYDFNNPGFSEEAGHFTQLVWKDTTTVGCGRMYCNSGGPIFGWYLVCEYWPAGNVINAFSNEVQSQVNGTTNVATSSVRMDWKLMAIAMFLTTFGMSYSFK